MKKARHWLVVGLCLWGALGLACAQAPAEDELSRLRREVEELKRQDREKQRLIETLSKRLDALQAVVDARPSHPVESAPDPGTPAASAGPEEDAHATGCAHHGHDDEPGAEGPGGPKLRQLQMGLESSPQPDGPPGPARRSPGSRAVATTRTGGGSPSAWPSCPLPGTWTPGSAWKPI